jgi:hypothetical protein
MALKCLFGFHRRSRRHVKEVGPRLFSACESCGRPMEKGWDGDWRLVSADAVQAHAEPQAAE